MHLWNFRKKRGQAIVAVLIGSLIVANLAMAQWSWITMKTKSGYTKYQGALKDDLLINAPHVAQLDGKEDLGVIQYQDLKLNYFREKQEADTVKTAFVLARYPDRENWPEIIGLWVHTGEENFFFRDEWREK